MSLERKNTIKSYVKRYSLLTITSYSYAGVLIFISHLIIYLKHIDYFNVLVG